MTTTRDELHKLIDELPDDQLELAAEDLRRRACREQQRESDDEYEDYAPGGIPFTDEEMAAVAQERERAFARIAKNAEQNRAAYAALAAMAYPPEDEGGTRAS